MHGYDSPDEVIGQHFSLTQVNVDLEDAQENVERLLNGESIPMGEFTRRRKDGSIGYHTFSASPIIHGGQVAGLEGFIIDITERKQIEKALQDSYEKYRSMVETANIGIMIIQDGRRVFYNSKVYEVSGYTDEEYRDTEFLSLIHPEDRSHAVDRIRQRLTGAAMDGPDVTEMRFLPKSGDIKWIETNSAVIQWKGRPAVQIFIADITERKRAEEALRKSEAKYRSLTNDVLDSSAIGIFILDSDFGVVWVNRALESYFGVRREEIVGRDKRQLIRERIKHIFEDPDRFAGKVFATYDDNTYLENFECHVLPDGERHERWLEHRSQPIRSGLYAGGRIELYTDITERKRAEEDVKQRNRELTILNATAVVVSQSLDLDEILNAGLDKVMELVYSDVGGIYLFNRAQGKSNLVVHRGVSRKFVREVESISVSEKTLAAMTAEGKLRRFVLSIEAVFRDRVELKRILSAMQEEGLSLTSGVPVLLQAKEEILGLMIVARRVPQSYSEAELQLLTAIGQQLALAIENARLYEQTRQAAETKAVLLREVNHRVKNNLTAILGLLYTARNRTKTKDPATCQSAMNDLIDRVRGLDAVHSMLSSSEWSPLPLSNLATRVIRASLQTLSRGKRVSVNVSPSPIYVTPNAAHHLALVINELAINTVKHALRERNRVQITFRIALDDGAATRAVRCEFRDDGPGYPEDVLRLERHNTGFDVIQSLVRDSLEGELSLRNDHGAVTTFQFQVGVMYDSKP
jgi:PAS domain S-box-containing protein